MSTRNKSKTNRFMKQVAWNIRKVSTPPARRSPRLSQDYPPLPSPTCPASVITAAATPNKDASRLNSTLSRRNPMRRSTLNASSTTPKSSLSSKRSKSTIENTQVDSSSQKRKKTSSSGPAKSPPLSTKTVETRRKSSRLSAAASKLPSTEGALAQPVARSKGQGYRQESPSQVPTDQTSTSSRRKRVNQQSSRRKTIRKTTRRCTVTTASSPTRTTPLRNDR